MINLLVKYLFGGKFNCFYSIYDKFLLVTMSQWRVGDHCQIWVHEECQGKVATNLAMLSGPP